MDFNELANSINKVVEMQNNLLIFIEEDINNIMLNNLVDDKKVEEILEQLLNLFQTEEVYNLFEKICKYYYYVNKELVIYYCNLYKEMYLDDDLRFKKIMSKV